LDDLEPLDDAKEDMAPTIEASNTIHFHLSSQALTRNTSPKNLKFTGIIHNIPVIVLIDSGNFHNILQPCIAQHLNLPITPSLPLSMMVGNGAFI